MRLIQPVKHTIKLLNKEFFIVDEVGYSYYYRSVFDWKQTYILSQLIMIYRRTECMERNGIIYLSSTIESMEV